MRLLNVVDRINADAVKLATLISDLETPAQNPVYEGPTKEDIINTLKNVLDIYASAQIEIENLNDELNYYMDLEQDYDD